MHQTAALGNNYSRPEGQNVGNFMTERNSSRVLNPPGGKSQIRFGGDEDMPPVRTKVTTDSASQEDSFSADGNTQVTPTAHHRPRGSGSRCACAICEVHPWMNQEQLSFNFDACGNIACHFM